MLDTAKVAFGANPSTTPVRAICRHEWFWNVLAGVIAAIGLCYLAPSVNVRIFLVMRVPPLARLASLHDLSSQLKTTMTMAGASGAITIAASGIAGTDARDVAGAATSFTADAEGLGMPMNTAETSSGDSVTVAGAAHLSVIARLLQGERM